MMVMHVTAAEAALAAAAITALSGAITGLIVQRTGRRRDYLTRLWEQRASVYVEALVEIDADQEIRRRVTQDVIDNKRDKLRETKVDDLSGSLDKAEINIKLGLFGSRKVYDAYGKYKGGHSGWMSVIKEALRPPSKDDLPIDFPRMVSEANSFAEHARIDLINIMLAELQGPSGGARKRRVYF
jgi:hypothetical protein